MNSCFTTGTRLLHSVKRVKDFIMARRLYVLQLTSGCLLKYSTFTSTAHGNHANILHLAGPDLGSHTSLIQQAGTQQGQWKGPEKGADKRRQSY